MSDQPGQPEVEALPALQAALSDLRSQGAERLDPARFRFLDALLQRLARQPAAVHRHLVGKLQAGLADYAERFAQARQAAVGEAAALAMKHPQLVRQVRSLQAAGDVRGLRLLAWKAGGPAECVPLAQLNRHIRETSPAVQGAATPGEQPGREELASVRRFRRTWGRTRSLDQLAQAASRRPSNAGPLNSHALMLQALALMQDLSPDYLRRFMGQVESLQWLEAAREAQPAAPAKAGKAAKPAKGGKPAKSAKTSRAR